LGLRRAGAIVVLSALVVLGQGCTKRVSRSHATAIDASYSHLGLRPGFAGAVADKRLTRKEAEEDLDELEWLLENRYSYRDRLGFDYRAALDAIRANLGDGIARGDLAYQIEKVLVGFGDGHSGVFDPDPRRQLCSSFLPFLVEETAGRLVAFLPDRSGFVEEGFPFLVEIDGRPVEDWLEAASRLTPAGSEQLQRYGTIRNLRYIEALRSELGMPQSPTVTALLAAADGRATRGVALPLASERPLYGVWPQRDSEVLPDNVGYLRIAPLMDPSPEALEVLRSSMERFRGTSGLVIDIRSNGGGSRAPLQTLLPYFMAPEQGPRVVNLAAYRLGVEGSEERFELRYLVSPDSPQLSEAERAAIRKASESFRPEWQPPSNEFSGWRYFVVSPAADGRLYYYDRPVVVLMDSFNYSAADIFLGGFEGLPNVTLMGQPSGGGSGCRVKHRLRRSLIGVALSTMVSLRPNGELYDGRGIQPDVLVEPLATDFIGRSDTALDAALAHLKTEGD